MQKMGLCFKKASYASNLASSLERWFEYCLQLKYFYFYHQGMYWIGVEHALFVLFRETGFFNVLGSDGKLNIQLILCWNVDYSRWLSFIFLHFLKNLKLFISYLIFFNLLFSPHKQTLLLNKELKTSNKRQKLHQLPLFYHRNLQTSFQRSLQHPAWDTDHYFNLSL